MNKRYTLFTTIMLGIIALMIVDSGFNNADSHTSGSPSTRTGSPGDGGATCKNCHAGPTPATQAGLITSTIPAGGYTAGQTYTITATIARQGHTKFGFEISPQNPAGALLGTLIVTNTTEMQLVGSGKYITHKTAGVSGTNSRTWVFNWTAPAAGTGDVTFYGAFNITNALNNSSGDTTVLSTLTVNECIAPAQPGVISGQAVICSNSGTLTYSVAPVAGATSYLWTVPVGWTIVSIPPYSETIQVQAGALNGMITVAAVNTCGTSATTSVSVSLDQLSVTTSSVNAACNGDSSGSVTAIPSFGVGAYTYSWSPGGGTTATISNLPTGNYLVTVTDSAGCISTAGAGVSQPSSILLNASSNSSFCGNANGSAAVVATGGTPGYTYTWNTVPVQTTAIATGLSAGNYTVLVTDNNGCTATDSVGVANIAGPATSSVSLSDVRCHNGNDGQATVNIAGGTSPFTYQWSPSGGTDSVANNLHAGAYSVLVTDANGCSSTSYVTINEPSPIILTTSSTDAACTQSDGSATVNATGGVGVYAYSWNTLPVQNYPTATNISAGSYIVTVIDSNGCTASATVGVSNTAGPVLSPGTVTNVNCFDGNDGELSVIVTSGAGPFSYLWLPSGGSDTLARNLHAGAYAVTVTDSNGCISVLTATVNEPTQLIADAGMNVSICEGTSVQIGNVPVASGGTPGYTYLWSPASGLNSVSDSTPVASPAGTTVYLLLVTDQHGCSDSSSVTITIDPLPAIPVVTISGDTLFSSTAVSYQWLLNGNTINGATSQFYVASLDGNYSVIVTGTNGCSSLSVDYFYNSISSLSENASYGLRVYPNPVNAECLIQSKMLSIAGSRIFIYNLLGEKLEFQVQKSGAGSAILNLNMLSPALYIIEITSGEMVSRAKFIKE
ncbi:MAG: T9SS type A sorting domain-containing protein [Bacteroidetes bacterium]|nr:T9SS type A sorting domain-containing protein [Bacteroidota bacterium]